MNCRCCGMNKTHGSNSHRNWAKNPSAYKMSAAHPYRVATIDLAAMSMKPTSAQFPAPLVDQGPPSTAGTGQSSLTGDSLTFSRANLQQRFATFKRNSTNPNAANIAAAMRTMFLN